MNSSSIKVLVIGQTPPPYHGQAMMIKRLVDAKFKNIDILHIRLAFSDEVRKIGKVSLSKLFHLFFIIYKTYVKRFSEGDMVLYYPPAGPNRTPIIRDLVLLFFIKSLFSKTVYHYRAAGLSDYLIGKSKLVQSICKKIYGKPDIGIQLSALNPKDAEYFQSKNILYIPNGLEDDALAYLPKKKQKKLSAPIIILFVGILREDKGLTCLINSLHLLYQKGIKNFTLIVMGEFNSTEYQTEVQAKITSHELHNNILFVGTQTGRSKWDYFAQADLLCFPTFFNSESFGNVLVEAMMFQLPVIATRWRGIPDIVTEKMGFLVSIKDENELADKIFLLMQEPELRLKMGEHARMRFLEHYTLQQHLHEMETMFLSFLQKDERRSSLKTEME
jgi:glycosyltransferase involved in cell wall biosynthesis